LRRHYLLAGVAVALALAAVIVAVGLRTGGASGATGSTADPGLPSGHPTVAGKGGEPTPGPTADASIQKKIAKLESASAKDPTDVATLLKLGDAYYLGQSYKRSSHAYEEVLRLDPGNATATVRLAMVWHADGDTARAEKAVKQVLDEQPGDQEAHYSMAIIYFSTDRSDEARQEWTIAAKLDPKSLIGRRSQSFVDLLEGEQSGDTSSSD
jgi:cytochrome c-type biogenesis protein CcmH/NrfG